MKTQINAAFQVHTYSEKVAEEIAGRIRNTIKDSDQPSDPLVEDWTGIDQEWPPAPEVYIFFGMEEKCEINSNGIPVKLENAIAGENVYIWMDEDILLEPKLPETVEQHVEWVGISINEYQHIYTHRKIHPHAKQYKCTAPTCRKHGTWYSLPESFVELARPECPSCNKLGQRV